MERYSRHIILSEVGQVGQDKLNAAKVLVIGAGGLGCPVLQYLVAVGIGTVGIVDFDTVNISNLQRQVLYGNSTLGENKAIAAKSSLSDLNPTITINAYTDKLDTNNAIELFDKYDIIVDGTDNFATRYLINDAAILNNKPSVYGAIYKFEGQVSVFNYNNGPSYRCLFPTPPKEGSIANCSEVGVLGVLPGIIGTMMANEVIKMVLNFDGVLSGELLCYNSRNTEISKLTITKKQEEFNKIMANPDLLHLKVDQACHFTINEITSEKLSQLENVQLIDVREPHEQPKLDMNKSIRIPLSTFENNLNLIDNSKTIIIYCQSGIRSKKAVEILLNLGFTNCYSLKGGVMSLIEKQSI
ncbi:HesA/MoeB/ThiF family protein [Hanstruepera marina]|uniref:HesA/MoeB/ThiF family protein n=1 Tax=Hanstruepera marina TaxID=2873265 RepID=UPI001CA6A20C|nr:HesA/MoeB/ThiF family protein [Hanstruepera marina]